MSITPKFTQSQLFQCHAKNVEKLILDTGTGRLRFYSVERADSIQKCAATLLQLLSESRGIR